MDTEEAGRHWEANAATWTRLAREGCDICRDLVNSPAFFGMLPEVGGQDGLDVGCGEGENTRSLARRGARMQAVDIAPTFVRAVQEQEVATPLGIVCQVASADALPFEAARFDFVTAFMSLMDLPNLEGALTEAHRVLKPGGFLQFSITHPCFQTPKMRWLKDENGRKQGMVCGDYFRQTDLRVEEWLFGAATPEQRAGATPFRIPVFQRTLSDWLNTVLAVGFQLEAFCEPQPDDAALAQRPELYDMQHIAYFLIIRARKP